MKTSRISLAVLFLALGLAASVASLINNNSFVAASGTGLEAANLPVGIAKGINPGRVVWVYNAAATNQNCTNVYGDGYFMDTNTNQKEVDRMVEAALTGLTGQSTLAGAWDAVFKYHNQTRGKGSIGYNSNESIFIKINATSTWSENINSSFGRNNNGYYAISETSPQVVLSVLRQLVYEAGIPESKIYVGDPLKHIYQDNYTKWHNEFPGVHYLDYSSTSSGREKVVKSTTAIVKYSDKGAVLKTTSGNAVFQDSLYTIFENMEYMINIPNLKAHEYAGATMFGKNHFGSQTRSDASHLHSGLVSTGSSLRNTYGQYRVQVDLMTHKLLGKKNLFYLMDAIYCSDKSITKPSKWQIAPFNNDWTSSIFLSQDPVAIESVGFDFLYAQYQGTDGNNSYPHMGAVDDYLHQLADSTTWPVGIVYDPENDGTSIGYSQGTHEHWNNASDKKYSRNLGTGLGIELLQHFISAQTDLIPVTSVTLNPENLVLLSGETSVLTATISPSDATDKTVNWTSGNTSVATVNSSGVVTAVAAGTATITVTTADGAKTATCVVTVNKITSTNLALNKTATSSSDENEGLTANYATDGGYSSRWSSVFSDPQWIYVDLGATYNITNVKLYWEAAYANSYSVKVWVNSAWVDVYSTTAGDGATDDLIVTPSQGRYVMVYGTERSTEYGYSLYEFEVYGDTLDAHAPTIPSGLTSPSQTQTSISLAWTASTDNVGVTGYDVYKDGTYSTSTTTTSCTIGSLAASTAYAFTVRAKDGTGNYSAASSALTVSTSAIPVTGVMLSSSSLSLTVGNTATLIATVSPLDASKQAVSWISGNTSVATVSSSGEITAITAGTANITVTTADGGITATCAITVADAVPVSSITLSSSSLNLTSGSASTLTATVLPLNATNQSVSWSSSNTSVASVSSSGVVTAVAAGTTTITVTTADGCKTATCEVSITSQTITDITVGVSGTITCKSSLVTLASLSGAYKNYKWSGPNSFSATTKSPSVSAPGIYTLTVTDTVNNCTVTAITNVLQNTVKPIARASSNGTLSCGTKTVSLKVATSTPNTIITWDGQTTGVNPVTMEWPGTYFVTTKDTVNGCTKRDSVTVAKYITYNSTQFYNNTFSAYANGTIADNATNGWTLDRSKIPSVTTAYKSNTTQHYFAVYSKRLTAQQLGGEGIFYSNVMNVSGKPNFQIGVNIATEGTMTSNDYVKLFYKLDGGAEIAWDSRTGAFSQDFRSPLLNANTVQIVVKVYSTVKGTTYVSNHYILQYQLYIQDCGYPMVVYSSATGAINCANPSIMLQANSSHAGATYKWSGPNSYTSSLQYPVVSVPGTYTVTASMPATANAAVLSSTATGTVTVSQNVTTPGASVSLPDTITSQTKYVTLSGNSPTSGVYYSWVGPVSFVSNQQNPVVTAIGAYTLTAVSPVNGCTSSATVSVVQNTNKSAPVSPIEAVPENISKEQGLPTIEIYPNPAGNKLFFLIKGTGSIFSIKIFNLRGDIMPLQNSEESSSLDVSKLSYGLYILIVETEKGIFRKKFLKL